MCWREELGVMSGTQGAVVKPLVGIVRLHGEDVFPSRWSVKVKIGGGGSHGVLDDSPRTLR